jgi:hypothetical protein
MLILAISVPKVKYCTGIDTQLRKKGFPQGGPAAGRGFGAKNLDMAGVCQQNEDWSRAKPRPA